MLDALESDLCLDEARLYAAGYSSGAISVSALGCVLEGRIAAIAAVNGLTDFGDACVLERPPPTLGGRGRSVGDDATLTAPDLAAEVSLTAAQRLFYKTLPPMVQEQLDPTALVTSMAIYPQAGVSPQELAGRIEASFPTLATMTGADFDQQIGSATSILNAVLVGIALISLIVGGLSVINTMAMSVAERTREIGIKRAIGGSRRRIVREFVTESSVLGFIGGAIGLILGAACVLLANELGKSSGTILFELTPQTALLALAFATILGGLAGLAPAVHAARLDPVAALRYE